MTRIRKILFLLLAAIAVITLLYVVSSKSDSQLLPSQTGTLADGSKVSLRKITHGTKHQYFPAPPKWYEKFIHLLPIRYQEKLGFGDSDFQFESSTGGDTVGIWLNTSVPVSLYQLRLLTIASSGHETVNFYSRTAYLQNGQGLSHWELVNYPRREKQFTLRLEERVNDNTWKPVVQWQISNPGYTSLPVWTAPSPSLPVTRQAAGFTFTLTSLSTYISTNGPCPITRAIFLITSNSVPVTNRVIKFVEITDATGNTLQEATMFSSGGEGKIICDCIGQLDPREAAWKLHVNFESRDPHPMNHPPGSPASVPTNLTLDFIVNPPQPQPPHQDPRSR